MMHYISKIFIRLAGWKIIGGIPEGINKCVVVVAPHTSMWDFVWGRLAYFVLRVKVKFLIKKEMFVFPISGLLNWLGGIPVDRSKSTNLVDYIAGLFKIYDHLYITITPEGTRKLNHKWKKGFYYIALKANVPIALGFLDYKKKEVGIGKIFTPSGNFEEEFKMIEDFYKGRGAKFPENFNLS
ncbi:MAG: 1-acyl-sn-glycerol-3-phosphate acyltransferase [Bacteroidales bacterium]|nr:1-acyl-sn-glycerol-3-phosphate acyltransferase [Bacteroidales bacterium]